MTIKMWFTKIKFEAFVASSQPGQGKTGKRGYEKSTWLSLFLQNGQAGIQNPSGNVPNKIEEFQNWGILFEKFKMTFKNF